MLVAFQNENSLCPFIFGLRAQPHSGLSHPSPRQPSNDPFYAPPVNISLYKEGDIMKWRRTPSQVRSLLYPINVQGAWQFMVRSTNTQGNPVGIVGTIIQPYNADPSKVLAYNYFEDSADVNCAPSYTILTGADIDTIGSQVESINMNAALTKGWNVLVTDYEGPNAAFSAGILAGKSTLNAIRATLKSGSKTGISPNAKVAIWGYSGGTIPSSWAGALQPSYAPELSKNLIGVAIGGWVTDLMPVVEKNDGTMFAGFVGAGMLGLASEYPLVNEQLFDYMDPSRVDQVKGLYSQCYLGALTNYMNVDFFQGSDAVFPPEKNVLEIPQVKAMFTENALALDNNGPVPHVPFFVYHGQDDEVIPFEGSQRVYDTWCSQGIGSMEFAVSESSGHLIEFIEGSGAALQWLSQRFDGVAPVQGCSRTVRESNLDYPGADSGFYSIASTTVEAILQFQLGPLLSDGDSPDDIEQGLYGIITGLIDALGALPFKRQDSEEVPLNKALR
ncbi:hypothetical protein JCM33374_g3484 [Metschnikowia sp. JCM 33374]|nr:hypothetical protein JCM33374_g3484 [Metschnikowia sp. JCM 33374]